MIKMNRKHDNGKWQVLMMVLLLLCFVLPLWGTNNTYYLLGRKQGLRGEHVFQMMQLEDGRMVVDTESDVCFWDGEAFQCVHRDSTDYSSLSGYEEYTRLFVDKSRRLWVKDIGKVACLDLETMRFLPECTALIGNPDDFYVDKTGDIWKVNGVEICRVCDSLALVLPDGSGRVQEVQRDSLWAYVFTSDGAVSIFKLKDGTLRSSYFAYDEATAKTLDSFSLVVRGADGVFYQLRMGWNHAVMLSFNPTTNEWRKHLDVDYALHTLIVTPELKAYISCGRGYWVMDLRTGEQHLFTVLHLPDGTVLQTGFNTICQDKDGGIWLGSYDDGILYSSPETDLFEMPKNSMLWTWLLVLVVAGVGTWIWIRRRRALKEKDVKTPQNIIPEKPKEQSQQESAFIGRARLLVEQNLSNTDYSVEQLAHDLCMERSGLYKKMSALIQISPVEFIRTIRLEHAARLLKDGGHTVAEVSELTGFSSPKYFSTCFQQRYGCRPSMYQ